MLFCLSYLKFEKGEGGETMKNRGVNKHKLGFIASRGLAEQVFKKIRNEHPFAEGEGRGHNVLKQVMGKILRKILSESVPIKNFQNHQAIISQILMEEVACLARRATCLGKKRLPIVKIVKGRGKFTDKILKGFLYEFDVSNDEEISLLLMELAAEFYEWVNNIKKYTAPWGLITSNSRGVYVRLKVGPPELSELPEKATFVGPNDAGPDKVEKRDS